MTILPDYISQGSLLPSGRLLGRSIKETRDPPQSLFFPGLVCDGSLHAGRVRLQPTTWVYNIPARLRRGSALPAVYRTSDQHQLDHTATHSLCSRFGWSSQAGPQSGRLFRSPCLEGAWLAWSLVRGQLPTFASLSLVVLLGHCTDSFTLGTLHCTSIRTLHIGIFSCSKHKIYYHSFTTPYWIQLMSSDCQRRLSDLQRGHSVIAT